MYTFEFRESPGSAPADARAPSLGRPRAARLWELATAVVSRLGERAAWSRQSFIVVVVFFSLVPAVREKRLDDLILHRLADVVRPSDRRHSRLRVVRVFGVVRFESLPTEPCGTWVGRLTSLDRSICSFSSWCGLKTTGASPSTTSRASSFVMSNLGTLEPRFMLGGIVTPTRRRPNEAAAVPTLTKRHPLDDGQTRRPLSRL